MFSYTTSCLAGAATLLSIVLTTILYRFSVSTYDKWEKLNVPYLKPVVPLFGNFLGVVTGAVHQVDFFRQVYYDLAGHKYGGFFLMRMPNLMIKDPDIIGQVLVKDFEYFQDRGLDTDYAVNPLMDNMFVMKNPRWKVIRNKLSPAFTSGKLRLMYDQIKECSDEMLKSVRGKSTAGGGDGVIEVRDEMGKYSTDVIGTCAFGLKLNAISDDQSEFRKYGKTLFAPSLRFLFKQLCTFISPSLLKIVKLADFPVSATQFFHSAFHETIAYREKNHLVRNDIVQHLIQARKDLVLNELLPPDEKFTESQIVANAFVLFAAGFETTSSSISFCLYELALKKQIQDKVRAEIKMKRVKYNGETNNDYLAELDYLEMVIAETLRKHSPLLALFRKASKTYHVPNESLIIEKDQKLIIPIHSLHYDPRYFPDPDVFDPERFSPEEKAKRPKYCYLPFGDGPRYCIGKRFAEMEMKLAISEILYKFEVEPCEKTEIPLRYGKKSFIIMPDNGIWLRFKSLSG